MIIEPATESDLKSMASLTRDALSFASHPDTQHWEAMSDEEMEAHLHAYLSGEQAIVLVARAEHATLGYVGARFEPDALRRSDRRALIELLAVAPPYRGRGFGTRLVMELLAALRRQGITRVSVQVVAANEAAVRFWRRAGFQEVSFVMEQSLSQEGSADNAR
jgi:ribosomal protein S18 acetylase RimI-like enzyme